MNVSPSDKSQLSNSADPGNQGAKERPSIPVPFLSSFFLLSTTFPSFHTLLSTQASQFFIMHGLIAPRPARPSQPSKTHRCQLPPGLVARRHVRETRDRPWLANSVLSDKSASKPEASPSFTPARDSSASTTAYQPPQLQQQPTTTTTPSEGAGSTSSRYVVACTS